jgi:hypothetical protein
MCEYYFNEDHDIAYKIDPVKASVVQGRAQSCQSSILVHTDVKITNIKKEKVRRTLSEFYPSEKYDLDSAVKSFSETFIPKLVSGSKKISEEEYAAIKAKFEG